jgi:hypothetical protein
VGHNSWSCRRFYISSSCSVSRLFFRFGGGRLLHNVQSIILRNPLEVPTIRFAIFTLNISYKAFLSVPPLPRCDRCPELHLQCRSLLSTPSSDIVAVCRLGPLFACCLVAAVSGLGPLCIVAFLALPTSLPERPSFRGSWCDIVFVLSLTSVSLVPCHSCTTGHLHAGGGQFPPGSTISPGSLLRLLAALCG